MAGLPGTRIRELLMQERDGRLSEAQRADIGTARTAGRFPPPLAGPASPQTASRGMPPMRDMAMAEFGTQPPGDFQKPGANAPLAAMLRVAPGLVPNPLIASPLSAAGELAAQQVEGSPMDLQQAGVAAAMPPAAAAAGRLARGVGRTLTRVMPSRFRAAHQEALGAADEVAQSLRPEVDPGQLFGAARAAGAEAVPASKTSAALVDLNRSIPANPASPALKTVREHMANIEGAIENGQMSLETLMQLRRDLGASLGRAPEMKALYKGLIGDLEGAAAAGGPGASMAKEALAAFKRDLGVSKFSDLVEAATSKRAISGADTPILNMPKLAKDWAKNAQEFTDLMGPDGTQAIGAFIQRFKSLPPEVAYNGWNMMLTGLFGAGGFAGGGAIPAVAAGVGQELVRNAAAVGKNPEALNRYMTTLVQAARAAAVTPTEEP